MPEIRISFEDDWTEAAAIDIQRKGDKIQLWFVLKDGRNVPISETSLADGTRTKLPFVGEVVRVNAPREARK